jgi:hypothetical protein
MGGRGTVARFSLGRFLSWSMPTCREGSGQEGREVGLGWACEGEKDQREKRERWVGCTESFEPKFLKFELERSSYIQRKFVVQIFEKRV